MTSDDTYTYVYDGENRLKEVKQGANTIASYTYDYMGRRTSVTESGTTTYFHYDGWNVVAETDSAGNTTATYTYDLDDQPMSMTRGGNTYYYQYNAHGDVVSLTNSLGQVVNTYTYDPWGKILTANETVTNPYRYAGYRYDSSTGLYYLQARYYSPATYRFLTKDPDGGDLENPLTLNPYIYVSDNPVNLIDPDGEFAQVLVAPLILAGATLAFVGAVQQYDPEEMGRALREAWTQTTNAASGVYRTCKNWVFAKGGKQRIRDTGLTHLPDSEIFRRARDKSLPTAERERYKKERKERQRKRKSRR